MTSPILKRGIVAARSFTLVSALALGMAGCGGGGGGGGSDDVRTQPAPQTFNGLLLTLWASGVQLTFIRAEGDALTSVETGAVTMRENPLNVVGVDSTGAPSTLRPSRSISGARYTYQRTSPEAGVITITGNGSGTPFNPGIPPVSANYFTTSFTRTYNLLFGTDGSVITGVSVNDSSATIGEEAPFPGILWTGAVLQVFGSGSVPIGWSLQASQGVNLPKLYPTGVNLERFEITPNDLAQPLVGYQFLQSSFTRFSDALGDFIEQGVGNKDLPPDPTLTLINFDYQPDPNTTNRARIRIFEGSQPTVIYDMTFLDLEKGTYVREDGSTGTFEFPFLD